MNKDTMPFNQQINISNQNVDIKQPDIKQPDIKQPDIKQSDKTQDKQFINPQNKNNSHRGKNNYNTINKTVSYGIIAIQTESEELYNIVDAFLSNIKKSLYIHSKSCRKPIHLKTYVLCKENLKFLMLTKRYSYGYYDIIHNKYNISDNKQVNKLLNEMTYTEINDIINNNYDELWNRIHKVQSYPQKFKTDFIKLQKNIRDRLYIITRNRFKTPEWEFPKGKKNFNNEEDIITAKREFIEETNLFDNDFKLYDNIQPLIEEYIGTDGLNYSYHYYIALVKPNVNVENRSTIETNNIGFYSYDSAYHNLRPYHLERKHILECIFNDIVGWINKNYNIVLTKRRY